MTVTEADRFELKDVGCGMEVDTNGLFFGHQGDASGVEEGNGEGSESSEEEFEEDRLDETQATQLYDGEEGDGEEGESDICDEDFVGEELY